MFKQYDCTARSFGYAFLKETKRYYHALEFTSGFHNFIKQTLLSNKDSTLVMRDGTSIPVRATDHELPLYWGIVNMKYLGGHLFVQNGDLTLKLKNGPTLFLTRIDDLFIVGEVLGEEAYRPLSNKTLRNKIVVDIGSFIGITPIYFARKGAKVYGYEILPKNYALAIRNVRTNGFDNRIKVRNLGVGGVNRTVVVPLSYGSYSFSIYRKNAASENTNINIITLQEIMKVNDLGHIDLLKLDCEGAEYEIFDTLTPEYLKKIKEIVMEVHGPPAPIVKKLKSCGFSATALRASIRACNNNFNENSS